MSPERRYTLQEGPLVVLGRHYYGPPRALDHERLAEISTDPLEQDWSVIMHDRVHGPHAELRLYDEGSFDAQGIFRDYELDRLRKIPNIGERATRTQRAIQQGLQRGGIGDTYIHALLPHQSAMNKRILLQAGKEALGFTPTIGWAAEAAIDYPSLEAFKDSGYEGVVVAPTQVIAEDTPARDNQPIRIPLRQGREILVYPYDGMTSHAHAFGDKIDAYQFADRFMIPRYNNPPNEISRKLNLVYVDGETYGGYIEGQEHFPPALLTALRERGVTPASLSQIVFDRSTLPIGRIIEGSSWSCPHKDLARWNGTCGCGGEEVGGRVEWRTPFYAAHHTLNTAVSKLIRQERTDLRDEEYVSWRARNITSQLQNRGGKSSDTHQSLLSAGASALVATTSCATFYGDPGTSGLINMAFAQQTLEHLRDAGMVAEAKQLEQSYRSTMRTMINPVSGKNGNELHDTMLEKRQNAHNKSAIDQAA